MANTTNYNWETPDDTDLVKDGAAAIRTLGSSIDTTTKALNPETTLGDIAYRSSTANTNTRLAIGTTGQVLTVAGGVPSWATPTAGDIEGVTAGTGISGGGTSGTVTITNSMATAIDAKGDLIVGTGEDTFSRLAVGTNGHTLVADSSTSTGLKWAAASGGGFVGVAVKNSGTYTIANNTLTSLTFNAEWYDTDGFHSTSTNTDRMTVPSGKAGYYKIDVYQAFQGNATLKRILDITKNGTAQVSSSLSFPTASASGSQNAHSISIILNLAVSDYITIAVYQNSGGDMTYYDNDLQFISMTYLGA